MENSAQSLPSVYASRADDRPAAAGGTRLLSLGLAMACLTVLVLAAYLTPSPNGYGSHTRLGLHSCQWMDRTGLPCPSCGMTTSFAWFVRGNLAASLYVQPMGALLALLTAAWVWVGLYVAVTGRPVYRLLWVWPGHYYLIPLFAWALFGWAWKIVIHLKGWDGWR